MPESAAYAVRTFLGGAVQARIPAGINAGALSATADDLSTWVGAVAAGNTHAMLDIAGSNPEEVEISGVSGNDITFSARGLEGTDDSDHGTNVTITLIHSPRDDREANKWVNELSGAATAANVALAADGANSLTGISVAASRIMARLAAGDYKACTPAEIKTLLAIASSDVSDLAEFIADTVGAMVSGNTESGITVTYDDSDNTLDFSATGASVVSGASNVATDQSTSSATLGGLATAQAVTLTTGTWALVSFFAETYSGSVTQAHMNFVVSGATTRAAQAGERAYTQIPSTSVSYRLGGTVLVTGLTPGSNTFTLQFASPSAIAVNFLNRVLSVIAA